MNPKSSISSNNDDREESNVSNAVNRATRDNIKMTLMFILALGIAVTFILVIFLVQNFHILSDIKENTEISNQTQSQVNQTKLFIESTEHEDERQEQVNKLEMLGRSNQTKTILNATQDLLEKHDKLVEGHDKRQTELIERQNNTTHKIFKEIKEAQEQNDLIQKTLQQLLNKYGGDGTIMLRYMIEQLYDKDPDQIIQEYRDNHTNTTNLP